MPEFETSPNTNDEALSVAAKTAVCSALLFFALHIFGRYLEEPPSMLFESVFRVLAVGVAAYAVSRLAVKKSGSTEISERAFISTVFFYGITLSLVYVWQIGVVLFDFFSGEAMAFSQTVRFLLGVREFTTEAFVTAFFLASFPYVAYYLALRSVRAR